MKGKFAILITASALAMGALELIAIPSAFAEPTLDEQETIFVTDLAAGLPDDTPPIVPSPDRTASQLVEMGHAIADDVRHGTAPSDEQDYMDPSYGRPSLTWKQEAFLLVTAVRVFAPDFARYYWTCGTGPACEPPWPPGAVMTPWNTPGMPPLIRRCPIEGCQPLSPPLGRPSGLEVWN